MKNKKIKIQLWSSTSEGVGDLHASCWVNCCACESIKKEDNINYSYGGYEKVIRDDGYTIGWQKYWKYA